MKAPVTFGVALAAYGVLLAGCASGPELESPSGRDTGATYTAVFAGCLEAAGYDASNITSADEGDVRKPTLVPMDVVTPCVVEAADAANSGLGINGGGDE